MPNESRTEDITIQGVGQVTPPPSPCGHEECRYVELDLIHQCGLPDEMFGE